MKKGKTIVLRGDFLLTKAGRPVDVTGWDPANLCEQCALVDSEARPCAAVDIPPERIKVARIIIKDFGLLRAETRVGHVVLLHIFKFPHLKWVLAEIANTKPFGKWQAWLEGHLYGYSEHAIAEYLKSTEDKKKERCPKKRF